MYARKTQQLSKLGWQALGPSIASEERLVNRYIEHFSFDCLGSLVTQAMTSGSLIDAAELARN